MIIEGNLVRNASTEARQVSAPCRWPPAVGLLAAKRIALFRQEALETSAGTPKAFE